MKWHGLARITFVAAYHRHKLSMHNSPIEFHRLHARASQSETGVDIASQGMNRHEPIWETLVAWHQSLLFMYVDRRCTQLL